VAVITGCRKPPAAPTPDEMLAENVAMLAGNLADLTAATDDIEALAESNPIFGQVLTPLRTQETIARAFLDDLNRRVQSLQAGAASPAGGAPAILRHVEVNYEVWLVVTEGMIQAQLFLEAARSETELADHQVESWARRFRQLQRRIEPFAPTGGS